MSFIEVKIRRWPGRPTSGRYVYRCANGWYWQCDMHEEEGVYGPTFHTMQEAFASAQRHAAGCRYRAAKVNL